MLLYCTISKKLDVTANAVEDKIVASVWVQE